MRHPLHHNVPIVQGDGRPTPQFQQLWQEAVGSFVQRGAVHGWSAPTGTAERNAFATYAAPVAAGAYDAAQMQALMNHVQSLSRHLKAVIDDASNAGLLL